MFRDLANFIRYTAVPVANRNLVTVVVFGTLIFFFSDSSNLNFQEDGSTFEYISKAFVWFPKIVLTALSVAFCVMVVVQLLKPSLRYIIHRRMLSIWLGRGYDSVEYILHRVNPENSLRQLELPIDELVAQIQATAEMILSLNLDNKAYWESEHSFIGLIVPDHKFDNGRIYSVQEGKNYEETISQRTIISYKIQRRLEQLQINTKIAWSNSIKLTGFIVSLTLTAGSLLVFSKNHSFSREDIYAALFVALLSTFLAPVIRDIFAIVEKIKN